MKKQKPCSICGHVGHGQTFCFNKKNKAINKFGKEAKRSLETRNLWLQTNANKDNTWTCYLQISPWCPKLLTIETLTVDHVKPKGSHKELAHDLTNLKPACVFCNGLKGSRALDKL
jgi:5-methylcytosine-specific restriction endonuclease McrA